MDDHINILVNGNDEQVRLVIRNMTGSIYLSEIKNINQQRLISLSVDDFAKLVEEEIKKLITSKKEK